MENIHFLGMELDLGLQSRLMWNNLFTCNFNDISPQGLSLQPSSSSTLRELIKNGTCPTKVWAIYRHISGLNPDTYPNLDAGSNCCTKPVSVGAEAQSIYDITSLKGVQVFSLIQVPQHGTAVLATRRTQRAIRWDSHAVQISSVAHVVGLQTAICQIPHLTGHKARALAQLFKSKL